MIATKETAWINETSNGVQYAYIINAESRTYQLKIKSKIPRRFYYSILNEIGLIIEEKHAKQLKY